ncbi:MAG TPA: glycosyltransferase, partial [Edaphobacter sp.]
ISGHNNYWFWGPNGATGEVMIVINGASLEYMRKAYDSVVVAGRMDNPYSMPYERRDIYLARGRKENLSANWGKVKHYD